MVVPNLARQHWWFNHPKMPEGEEPAGLKASITGFPRSRPQPPESVRSATQSLRGTGPACESSPSCGFRLMICRTLI